jgi:hypothetical protein
MSIYKDENSKLLWLLLIVIAVLIFLSIKFRREIRALRRQLKEIDSWR